MKKRLIALLLSLVMLLTCMGAALETVVDTADTAADAAEQTDTAAPAEPTGEDTTDAEPTDEPDASVEPTEEPDAEPSAEPEQPTDATEDETPAEPSLYEQFMACSTQDEMNALIEQLGEDAVTAQLTEAQLAAVEERYSSLAADESSDAEENEDEDTSSYPQTVNFTNVAPFLDPVTGSGSTSFKDTLSDAWTSIKDTISGWFAPSTADDTSASVKTTSGDTEEKDGMVYSKTATKNADGSYTIKIETYATGTVTSSSEEKPTDIVLVIDQSGSMANCIQCGKEKNYCRGHYTYKATYNIDNDENYYIYDGSKYVKVKYCDGDHVIKSNKHNKSWVPYSLSNYGSDHKNYVDNNGAITPKTSADGNGTQFYTDFVSRKEALQDAVTKFTNAVAEKAKGADGILGTNDDVDHRIAVVGFANTDSSYGANTGVFIGNTLYKYETNAASKYSAAFQDMNDAKDVANVRASINALKASGATRTDYGLDMAKGILDENPVAQGTERNRVVVVFTDGSPTSSSGFNLSVANNAIDTAKDIKDGGTTVYSIGVFSGANASSAGTAPKRDLGNNDDSLPAACNWFMQQVSSNNGTPQNPSYYLSAGDAETLSTIFENISKNIGSTSVKLGESSVVRDVVTKYFDMPSNADSISVMTYDCTGKTDGKFTFAETGTELTDAVKIDSETNTIDVSGFDFAGNYCREKEVTGQSGFGKKLVISFDVEPKEGFIGGNDVPTNVDTSGIYEDLTSEKATFTFPEPTVNVPINATVAAKNYNVYLKGSVPTADEMYTIDNYSKTDLGWRADYVTITGTLNSNVSNTEDGSYTVTAAIKPKSNGANSAGEANDMTGVTDTATSNVYVYVPELTFQDSEINLGDTADYANNRPTDYEKWVHVGADDSSKTYSTETGVTMYEANAPTLALSYSPTEDAFTEDTPVKVTVKIGSTDVTSKVQFKHGPCSHGGCQFKSTECQFIVHLKTFDLKITKSIDKNESTLYGARDFVFNVKSTDENTDINVVVHVGSDGTGSTVVKGLPIGTYTVTEDTTWSWRYTLQGVENGSGSTGTVSYTSGNSADYTPTGGASNEIVFTNRFMQAKWLSFTASVRNFFAGTAGSK